jgi:hypothetical protein
VGGGVIAAAGAAATEPCAHGIADCAASGECGMRAGPLDSCPKEEVFRCAPISI